MRYCFFSLWALLLLLSASCDKEGPTVSNPAENQGEGRFDISLIEDEVGGVPLIVAGSGRRNFIVAFERDFAGGLRTFTPVNNKLPVIMEDDLGNQWDVFGKAIAGPNAGAELKYVNSGMGFWFAFTSTFPGLALHGSEHISVNVSADTSGNWGVPTAYVAQGTGFDGIPSLSEPEFSRFNLLETDPADPFYIADSDMVIAVSLNGQTKVYPHAILDWHEVINDEVGGVPVAVTYCPLTGTGKVWVLPGNDAIGGFGVSGFLYNSNLLAFDRSTESFWFQLEGRCVFGSRRAERLTLLPFVETTWGSWRSFESNPLVMTQNTGIDRDYTQYPYGNYRTSDVVTYPLLYEDNRLPKKRRVFCLMVNGNAKAYQLSDF